MEMSNEILSIVPGAWAAFLERIKEANTGLRVFDRRKEEAKDKRDYDVVAVRGTLLATVPEYLRYFGVACTGYDEIVDEIDAAISSGNDTLMIAIDSPGGMVKGIDTVLDALDRAKETKHIIAHISGLGCSAAYWIATKADEITATRLSEVGSIGAFSVMYDVSAQAEKKGVEAVVTRSGKHKGAGVPGAPITEEQREEQQRQVDAIADAFFGDVAMARPDVDISEIQDAGVWLAGKAAALGLVDRVVASIGEAAQYEEEDIEMSDKQDAAKIEAANVAEATAVNAPDAGKIERERCTALLAEFADDPTFAREAIDRGLSVSEAKAERYDVLRARTEALAKVGGESPVGKASKEADEGAPVDEPQDFIALGRARAKADGISLSEACEVLARENPQAWKSYQQQRTVALAQ